MRVAVSLVLFHTEPAQVLRALGALAASEQPVEVWIHVNELDSMVPALDELPVHMSRGEENLGFAGGHNRLLASAFASGADMVVIHNPDLTLGPAALGTLVEAVAKEPLRLLGPSLERADSSGAPTGLTDTLGIRWTPDGRHLDIGQGEPLPALLDMAPPRRVAGISGACLVVPRVAYERIVTASGEFFDEDFFAYREDAELALRAELLGIESWLVPQARGLHVRTLRGTQRGVDERIDRLGVRNRFLIAFKWGRRRPGLPPLVLARDLVVIAAVLLRERTSIPGLMEAWRLRHVMHTKRDRVVAAVNQPRNL